MSDGYGTDPHRAPNVATTRDLLDAAARHVAARDGEGFRQAKAKVHAMALADLLSVPAVRRMLFEASSRG